ncbi:hypothetical protein AKG12_19280 [Agrobacterium sp. SUL3]|nr:hypothetical protein AKG12_19280 [Agrobacterium sp. SUL3]
MELIVTRADMQIRITFTLIFNVKVWCISVVLCGSKLEVTGIYISPCLIRYKFIERAIIKWCKIRECHCGNRAVVYRSWRLLGNVI